MRLSTPTVRHGLLGWLLQRISGIFLLFFLGAHLWALHIAAAGTEINWSTVLQHLNTPFFKFLDASLLALVLYHGLYGLRGIVFDFITGHLSRTVITWAFLLLGLVAFSVGFITLLAFLALGIVP